MTQEVHKSGEIYIKSYKGDLTNGRQIDRINLRQRDRHQTPYERQTDKSKKTDSNHFIEDRQQLKVNTQTTLNYRRQTDRQ